METINYFFEQFSIWELLVYAFMYGIGLTLFIGCVVTVYKTIRSFIKQRYESNY